MICRWERIGLPAGGAYGFTEITNAAKRLERAALGPVESAPAECNEALEALEQSCNRARQRVDAADAARVVTQTA